MNGIKSTQSQKDASICPQQSYKIPHMPQQSHDNAYGPTIASVAKEQNRKTEIIYALGDCNLHVARIVVDDIALIMERLELHFHLKNITRKISKMSKRDYLLSFGKRQ